MSDRGEICHHVKVVSGLSEKKIPDYFEHSLANIFEYYELYIYFLNIQEHEYYDT